MSKQTTLFQSWGGQTSKTPIEKPCSSKDSSEDIVDLCDSFEDGDDAILCEAESEFSTHGPPLEDEADNPSNISIGAEGFTPTQAQSQNPNCPGFDKSAGKLWIYPTNYPVRDYQFNIVNKSLFKNTMVTLPTGLGKTFIAAVVMYNFYRWYPQGKVIFMAPTKPLVAQQIEACYNIMGIPQDHTAEMTGSMGPPKREKAWHDKRVFFLTPQVLTNDLSRGSCPAEYVKCLVIDEAHKALGNHAYCQVVRELVKYTEQFRVLALSATPGSDIKAVQQVLSNLLISHIEIRTEESIDIRQYSHERVVDKVVVPLGDELTKVKTKFIHIMEMVVNKLKRHGVLYNRDTTSLSKFLILKAREAYRQNPPERLPKNQFGIVEADFALAMSLYHGYELLQLHGSRSLFNYLEGIVSGDKGYGRTKAELSKNGDFNELIGILRQKYSVPQNQTLSQAEAVPFVIGHPKMEKLQEIVLEHFKQFEAKNAETRVMIFSQYRDSVQEITDMLNRHRPLVKVMSFIGQSSAGKSTKGFTQKEQLKVMKQFREGGYNTLVSTCVGEEGLDIGDVDLIICFDAHKSPIRLVQRMGRTGRKREGRIVMLVTQGKEEQIYNQSQYSKRSIHKAILNGAKSLHFYQHSPRMLPDSVNPTVHKMHITINQNFKPTRKISTEPKAEKNTNISSYLNKEKPDLSNGLITKEEYEELHPWLVPEYEIPKLPQSCMVHLSRSENNEEEDSVPRGSFLLLSEWTPWQNTLQETSDIMDHSMQTKHLVQLMEFIQLQNILDPEDDPYELEMAAYFNEEDVLKPHDQGADSITRFCVTKTTKDESTDVIQSKAKRKRFSTMLPAFAVDQSEEESEEELPSFPFLQKNRSPLKELKCIDNPNLNEDEKLSPKFSSKCPNPQSVVKDVAKLDIPGEPDSNHCEDVLIRKIGRNDQRKSGGLFKSKAKDLDLKMKNNGKIWKRKKNKNINRSVIELLKSADENDFDKTPPDVIGHNHENSIDLTDINEECDNTNTVEAVNPQIERQYVVRTPPSVEEAIKVCEAAELESSRVKIDLLELIDEWEKENREGKYLFLPESTRNEKVHCAITSNKELNFPNKGHKISESINNIYLNTSLLLSGVTGCKTVDKRNPKDVIDKVDSLCIAKRVSNESITDIASQKDKLLNDNKATESEQCNGQFGNVETNTDLNLSSSFTVLSNSEQSNESEMLDTLNNSKDLVIDVKNKKEYKPADSSNSMDDNISCNFDIMDIETDSLLNEIEINQSQCLSPKTVLQSNDKTEKLKKELTQCSKNINTSASPWVSDNSDEELFEKIRTPNVLSDKDAKRPVLRTNTNTQFTFTQALNCLHSGNITTESDSCSDASQFKDTRDRKSVGNESENLMRTSNDKDNQNIEYEDLSSLDQDFEQKKDIPQDTCSSRRASTSSEESEQPQFDLGFDIDEDIIPPSPETSQRFQVTGKSLQSQTFKALLSQNRFSSSLSSKFSNLSKTDETPKSNKTTCSKSKRSLKMGENNSSNGNDLGCLEEELESQSILDSLSSGGHSLSEAAHMDRTFPNPKDEHKKDKTFDNTSNGQSSSEHTNLSSIQKKTDNGGCVVEAIESEDMSNKETFESSFALLDDDFDDWIGDDVEEMPKADNVSNTEKLSPCMNNLDTGALSVKDKDVLKSVVKEIHEDIAESSLQSKRNTKSLLKSRKSVFCPTDLSLDDSFGFENDGAERNAVMIDTPNSKQSKDMFKNTSTPVIVTGKSPCKFKSPAITPLRNKDTTNFSDSFADEIEVTDITDRKSSTNSDNDDSFVIRKKKTKPLFLESPKSQLDLPVAHKNKRVSIKKNNYKSDSESSHEKSLIDGEDNFDDSLLMKNNDYFQKNEDVIQIDSEDDFDKSSMFDITHNVKKTKNVADHRHVSTKSKPGRKANPKRTSNPFIEEEVDLSDEEDVDASSDETDHSDLDKYEGSFIQDTQCSQAEGLDQTDIHALYLKSVRSPEGVKGGFKLKYDYDKNIDVFSQMPCQEQSEYMEDSFCVGSEEDDWLAQDDYHGEITVCNNKSDILQSGKKRRRGVANLQTGRQRELHFGRMKALDELRSKLAKKNKEPRVGNNNFETRNKSILKKTGGISKKASRIAILENSSSDDDEAGIQKEQSMTSPCLNVNKNRKRVRLISSSDEELQESNVASKQQRIHSGNEMNTGVCGNRLAEEQNTGIYNRNSPMASSSSNEEQKQNNFQVDNANETASFSAIDLISDDQSLCENTVEMTKIKSRNADDKNYFLKLNDLQDNGDDMNLLLHPNKSKSDTLCIIVDSKEVSGGQDIISSLRFTHKVHVSAAQLPGCDYIVSNRMAVERKQWSDFSNGANRSKLIDRIQHLGELYDRPCLIVEKDRVKTGEEKSERQVHWTKYIDSTCAMLLKSRVKVLFTDTQIETANVLADLCQLENRKGMNIPTTVELMSKKTNMVKFYISFPKLNYIHALNLCYGFTRVSDFLNSSITEIEKKGKMSANRATEVFNYIRRDFDTSMLPTKHK